MKSIKEVYPECKEDYCFYSPYDYRPLLESLGFDICLQVDDENWQGDSRLLFKDGERWGILIFGWGSCSGCDALQGCNSYDEVDELRQQLLHDIHWEPDTESALQYMNEHDWEGDYSWHYLETREFVNKTKTLLQE